MVTSISLIDQLRIECPRGSDVNVYHLRWTGLNEKRQRGQWEFTNREDVAVINWKSGGPRVKRRRHKKNCALVKNNLKWRNKRCNKYTARYVCEIVPPQASSPTTAATSPGSSGYRADDRNVGKRKRKGNSGRRRARRNRKNLHDGFFYGL